MKNNLKILAALLIVSLGLFSSCGEGFDNDIDEKWKNFNEEIFDGMAGKSGYKKLTSLSGDGFLYYKPSNVLIDEEEKSKSGEEETTLKLYPDGTPHATDSVVCRYKGWFYNYDMEKVVFDSTEGTNNMQLGVGKQVNRYLTGLADMLQYMKVGDEYEVCLPYELGFFGYRESYNGYGVTPYTTVWYNIKLLKIIPGEEVK